MPLKADGATQPLFLVHGQSGEISIFKRVVERIREDIPVYGLEARGLYGDDEPIRDLREIAAYYITEIRSVQPLGPILIGGFSAGAQIAMEIAHQLDEAGEPPQLILFDFGPANLRGERLWYSRVLYPFMLAKFHWQNYRGLGGQRRSAYRRETFRRMVRRTALRMHLSRDSFVVRMSLRAGRPQPAGRLRVEEATRTARRAWDWEDAIFPHRFTLFRAKIQRAGGRHGRTLGFDEHLAPGGLDVRDIPGHHEFMFVERNVYTLIAELEDWVDRSVAALAPRVMNASEAHGG